MFEKTLATFDKVVAQCPRFERKGKTVPYTSANGHMFALINKEGQLGFRYSKAVQEKYIKEWQSDYFKSYGATMNGHVLIPDNMLKDINTLAKYLNKSYDYVMALDPK